MLVYANTSLAHPPEHDIGDLVAHADLGLRALHPRHEGLPHEAARVCKERPCRSLQLMPAHVCMNARACSCRV